VKARERRLKTDIKVYNFVVRHDNFFKNSNPLTNQIKKYDWNQKVRAIEIIT
jgi:hypothetical protein